MTDCNRKPLPFSNCKRRKVEVDFKGGDVTSVRVIYIGDYHE